MKEVVLRITSFEVLMLLINFKSVFVLFAGDVSNDLSKDICANCLFKRSLRPSHVCVTVHKR